MFFVSVVGFYAQEWICNVLLMERLNPGLCPCTRSSCSPAGSYSLATFCLEAVLMESSSDYIVKALLQEQITSACQGHLGPDGCASSCSNRHGLCCPLHLDWTWAGPGGLYLHSFLTPRLNSCFKKKKNVFSACVPKSCPFHSCNIFMAA